ncbi:MAG: hypothetical protein J6X49_17990 [Victivallales bacterium]|nr:hypothetical protein [Victivallales bacterium]
MANNNENNNNEEDEGWCGCFGGLILFSVFGFAIYQIVLLVINRNVTGLGFLDILKRAGIWIVATIVVNSILTFIFEKISKRFARRRQIKRWEKNELPNLLERYSITNDKISAAGLKKVAKGIDMLNKNLKKAELHLRDIRNMDKKVK